MRTPFLQTIININKQGHTNNPTGPTTAITNKAPLDRATTPTTQSGPARPPNQTMTTQERSNKPTKKQRKATTKITPVKAKTQQQAKTQKVASTTRPSKLPILQQHPAFSKANLKLSHIHQHKYSTQTAPRKNPTNTTLPTRSIPSTHPAKEDIGKFRLMWP